MSRGHNRDNVRNERVVDGKECEAKVECLRLLALQLETAERPWNIVNPKLEWFEQQEHPMMAEGMGIQEGKEQQIVKWREE